MAAWQYDCRVIPHSGLDRWLPQGLNLPAQIDDETLETVDWWSGHDRNSLIRDLSTLLPRHPTWDAKATSWGSYEGHRVNLRDDEGRIELTVRIDVQRLADGFVARLLRMLGHLDCLIVSAETRRIFEPTPEALWDDLQHSSARRFVDDPQAFLSSLSTELARRRAH